MKIELCDGKYTYVLNEITGEQYALRNGETWRDLTGDKFVMSLAQMVESLVKEKSSVAVSKYRVAPNTCTCRTEFCRCDTWAIYSESGERHSTHCDKDVAIRFMTALNTEAAYNAKIQAQAAEIERLTKLNEAQPFNTVQHDKALLQKIVDICAKKVLRPAGFEGQFEGYGSSLSYKSGEECVKDILKMIYDLEHP